MLNQDVYVVLKVNELSDQLGPNLSTNAKNQVLCDHCLLPRLIYNPHFVFDKPQNQTHDRYSLKSADKQLDWPDTYFGNSQN